LPDHRFFCGERGLFLEVLRFGPDLTTYKD